MEKSCYRAAMTKARAMYGRRFSTEQYKELMRCANVNDIAEYLQSQTDYGKYLTALPQGNVHRGQLESLLRRSLSERFLRLWQYDRKDGVLGFYMKEQEIATIVAAANAVVTGDVTQMIADLPLYIKRHLNIPVDELGNVRTFADLARFLRNTPYADAWNKATADGTLNPSRLEQVMLKSHYAALLAYADKLGKEGKALADIIRSEMGIRNFVLIYRLKVFFHYTPEQILPYLLETAGGYDLADLKKIAEECDKEQLMQLFIKTYCRSEEPSEYPEGMGKRALNRICRHTLSFSTSPSVALYSYMRLAKDEVEDIITITEGVRYQVKAQNLKPLLFTQTAREAIG